MGLAMLFISCSKPLKNKDGKIKYLVTEILEKWSFCDNNQEVIYIIYIYILNFTPAHHLTFFFFNFFFI